MQGYIKLYRKTMCSPIWQDPYYFKLWMYCLMKASHKEHDLLVGNKIVKLSPGEFVTGRSSLADDLNKGMKPKQKQSEISWWRYLNNLEQWGMLNIKKTNKYSVVSIVKWNEYQETEQQVNNNRTTTEQQLNTNKNGNNVKNGKKKDSRQKQVYDESSIYYKLASMLYEEIKKNLPDKKEPNLNNWADDFRKLVELDKKKVEHVEMVIKWTQGNSFWWKNVLSASKFRDQYERLAAEVRAEKTKNKPVSKKVEEIENDRNVVSQVSGALF